MQAVKFELIWHSVYDVHYLVEADTEHEAIERLTIYLCDPDDDNAEGIEEFAVTSFGTTASTAPVE
jgi:hypothetical protein